MVQGLFKTLSSLPNPALANELLKQINCLVDKLTQLPPERIKSVTNLLDDVIELQRQNPGNTKPLEMAVQLVCEINKLDVAKITELRGIIKEAAKLPLNDILKTL